MKIIDKLGKRKAIIIGSSALLVVAAAVAIPVGIVYGTQSSSSEAETKKVDFTSDANQLQSWSFGSEGSNKAAPSALPTDKGFNPSEYDVSQGVLIDTNVTVTGDPTTSTKPETDNLYVTYEYPALSGGNKLQVTYKVALAKATPGKMDSSNKDANVAQDFIWSSAVPSVDFNAVLLQKFPGYFTTDATPVFTKADGTTVITGTDLASLNAGDQFKATYTASLNLDYAVDNAVPSGKYVVTYSVKPLPLTPPAQLSEQNVLTVGATFVLPPAKDAAANFKLASTTPKTAVTAVSSTPAGMTPAVGSPIVAANVGNYDFGASFNVTYSYVPVSANYSGGYDYTFSYAISKENAVTAPSGNILTAANLTYGNIPTTNPVAPTNPNGSVGYVGTFVSAKVKVQSVIPGADSPAVNVPVVFADAATRTINSGTTIEVTFNYVARPGFTGAPEVITQDYIVGKQDVSALHMLLPLDDKSFVFGGNPTQLVFPSAPPSTYFDLTDTWYYFGQITQSHSQWDVNRKTVADIQGQGAGSLFTIVKVYKLKPNYANTATDSAGKVGDVLDYFQPFKVAPASVTYTGGKTYADTSVPYGTTANDPLLAVPSTLPDSTTSTNGDKFVRDTTYGTNGVTYSFEPVNGVPAAGTTTLNDIATWPAGVKITATYQFKGNGNYAASAPVTVTKLFTIQQVPATAPATTIQGKSFVVGSPTEKPTNADAPAQTGYTVEFTKAEVTKSDLAPPANNTDVSDWQTKGIDPNKSLNTFKAGTEITVTYTYTLDGNHSGTQTVLATQIYTVKAA